MLSKVSLILLAGCISSAFAELGNRDDKYYNDKSSIESDYENGNNAREKTQDPKEESSVYTRNGSQSTYQQETSDITDSDAYANGSDSYGSESDTLRTQKYSTNNYPRYQSKESYTKDEYTEPEVTLDKPEYTEEEKPTETVSTYENMNGYQKSAALEEKPGITPIETPIIEEPAVIPQENSDIKELKQDIQEIKQILKKEKGISDESEKKVEKSPITDENFKNLSRACEQILKAIEETPQRLYESEGIAFTNSLSLLDISASAMSKANPDIKSFSDLTKRSKDIQTQISDLQKEIRKTKFLFQVAKSFADNQNGILVKLSSFPHEIPLANEETSKLMNNIFAFSWIEDSETLKYALESIKVIVENSKNFDKKPSVPSYVAFSVTNKLLQLVDDTEKTIDSILKDLSRTMDSFGKDTNKTLEDIEDKKKSDTISKDSEKFLDAQKETIMSASDLINKQYTLFIEQQRFMQNTLSSLHNILKDTDELERNTKIFETSEDSEKEPKKED